MKAITSVNLEQNGKGFDFLYKIIQEDSFIVWIRRYANNQKSLFEIWFCFN